MSSGGGRERDTLLLDAMLPLDGGKDDLGKSCSSRDNMECFTLTRDVRACGMWYVYVVLQACNIAGKDFSICLHA